MKVYLAGPISGCSYKKCIEWRKSVENELIKYGFSIVSPMRGKEFLKDAHFISPRGYDEYDISVTDRGIFRRDKFDVSQSDILLVSLINSDQVSIGTMMEMAWGHMLGKYIITVMVSNGIYDHIFVNEVSDIIFSTLDAAVVYIKEVFGENAT